MPDCIDKIRLLNDPLFITLKVEKFYVCGRQNCTCAIYKNQTQNSNEQKKNTAAKIISFSEVGLKKKCLIEF